jgi:WhiB family transcriptional regulator, redox-sensing transcriptional regulator
VSITTPTSTSMAVTPPATWQGRAACRGPKSLVFFPPAYAERRDERAAREAKAKTICGQCAVQQDCLDFALGIREQHGIWGGTTESERRAMLGLG